MRKCATLLIVAMLPGSAWGAEDCNGVIGPAPSQFFSEAIVYLKEGEECTAYRFVTPEYRCEVLYDIDHGPGGFSCGEALSGEWGLQSGEFTGSAFSIVGTDRKVDLPDHANIRATWLAPIDTEGLHTDYPSRIDDYIDLYPESFSRIGERVLLDNDGSVQSYNYTTLNKQERTAIAGTIDAKCVGVYFLSWVERESAPTSYIDMVYFLENLHLEKIDIEGEEGALMCDRLP